MEWLIHGLYSAKYVKIDSQLKSAVILSVDTFELLNIVDTIKQLLSMIPSSNNTSLLAKSVNKANQGIALK